MSPPVSTNDLACIDRGHPIVRCELNGALSVPLRSRGIGQDEQRLGPCATRCAENALEIVRALHRHRRKRQAESLRGEVASPEIWGASRHSPSSEYGDTGQFRQCLLEQIEPFGGKFRAMMDKPVAFPPGRARLSTSFT